MPFKDLISSAKKNTPQREIPTAPKQPGNLIEAAESTKAHTEKKDISYADSEIKGFVPRERSFGSRTSSDPKHGSIIKNIASQSNANQQSGANATWEECKHLKKSDFGKDYCAEYHSLCAKDRCRKARK